MFHRAPFHGDAPKDEFLAMTFVTGPEEAVFQDDHPAKLRFFMGYADEFSREDGTEQVGCDPSPINTPRFDCVESSALFSFARRFSVCEAMSVSLGVSPFIYGCGRGSTALIFVSPRPGVCRVLARLLAKYTLNRNTFPPGFP